MDDIEIVDYDPGWPKEFEAEALRLWDVLPKELLLGIEHIGSTAIPGLSAKPIIDIAIAVPSLEEARATIVEPLEALGYSYWRANPQRDRMFFVKGLPPSSPKRTHHVHVTELSGEVWTRHLFRDYLRTHTDEAQRYADLKYDLARRYRLDREGYTAAKTEYITRIMAKL